MRRPFASGPESFPALTDLGLALGCGALAGLAVKTPWADHRPAVLVLAGAMASLAVLARRRHPVLVSLVGAVASLLTGNPGPLAVGVGTWAARRPARQAPAALGVATLGLLGPGPLLGEPLTMAGSLGALGVGAALVGAGRYVATRRELVTTLAERVGEAEAARALREQAARAEERTAMARDMHDVLAHKVSLIALHAGALELRSEDTPELAEGLELIRSTAHEALDELRSVLRALRADGEGGEPVGTLDSLVASWRATGLDVSLDDGVGHVPADIARTAHRVVQEGLTNAARHAPGAPVHVLAARRRGTVSVEVTSGAATSRPDPDVVGAGLGLVGLAERCDRSGGRLEAGPTAGGGWRLAAVLPAPADLDRGAVDAGGGR